MITLITKLLYIILAVFIFIISLDPGGVILNLKMPLFILLTFLSSFLYLKKKISIPKSILQIFLLLHVIPLYSICLASISGNLVDMEYAIGHCKSLLFVYLFFTLIILDFEKIYKIFFVNGCILATITLIIYLYIFEYAKQKKEDNKGKKSQKEVIYFLVTMIKRNHLYPYRTQKLSFSALKILGG